MLYLIVTVQSLFLDARARVTEEIRGRRLGDRGSVTLEQVVVSLGLFVVAGLLVAGITVAVNSRLGGIK